MNAILSKCGTYRYVLTRELNQRGIKPQSVLFVMLNPSTADASTNDPTIRRCISFAERESFQRLTVVNLFALRATNPTQLKLALDPIGEDNDQHLAEQFSLHKNSLIIAAWGSHCFAEYRALQITRANGPFYCLGKTKNGSPKHPLYVSAAAPLMRYP